MKRLVFTMASLLLIATLFIPTTLSIDYQVACDQCMQQALDNWNACWQRYPDEGDAECMGLRRDAEIACQIQYCIYINN
jgi:hypothetical protein